MPSSKKMRTPLTVLIILLLGPLFVLFFLLFEKFAGFTQVGDVPKLILVMMYVLCIVITMLLGPVTLYIHKEGRSQKETVFITTLLIVNVAAFFWWISIFLAQASWFVNVH